MHLNLKGNVWLEGGSVPTQVVLQLLEALSCSPFPVFLYSGRENELPWGQGPRDHVSMLHFIMLLIFSNVVKSSLPDFAAVGRTFHRQSVKSYRFLLLYQGFVI